MKTIYETRFERVGEAAEHYGAKITSSQSACDWARRTLNVYFGQRLDQEEFLIAALDTKNRVRRVIRITRGTLDSSLVHPREVFRPAIALCAASILLIHNHPSGETTPSREDHVVTDRLTEAGKLLGIQVLDHLIVTEDDAISLREVSQ